MNRSIDSGRDGCRYCVPDADGYSQCFRAVDGRQKSIFIDPGSGVSRWRWTIDVSGKNYHHYAVEINFCPFCGRPLRDPPAVDGTPTYELPNNPLTLEELREMDGEPVWIEAKHCGYFADVLHNVAKSEGKVYVRLINHRNLQESGCGKTWIAYRRKPED